MIDLFLSAGKATTVGTAAPFKSTIAFTDWAVGHTLLRFLIELQVA
ncbi:MAG: hypothetical protein ACRD4E_02670 [Bryobacteraceae bacterium]